MALYSFWGKVRHGKKRGRLLGFPTANVWLHKKIPIGIYAGSVRVNQHSYAAAIFIGSAETFGETDVKAECFLLDFNDELYGQWISIHLLKQIRKHRTFTSPQALVKCITRDVRLIRNIFGDINNGKTQNQDA
jgi:riboflavin kinase / FMN adenylyltransferase